MNEINLANLCIDSDGKVSESELKRVEGRISSFLVWKKDETANIDGFLVKNGSILFLDEDGIPVGVSSGRIMDGKIPVYFKCTDRNKCFIKHWMEKNPMLTDALWESVESTWCYTPHC